MFSVNEILKATKGRFLNGSAAVRIKGISIDTRTVKAGELYIAIKGARLDGHAFLSNAFENGACGIIVCSKYGIPGHMTKMTGNSTRLIIEVPDTVRALGEIANFHRNRFDIPVAAITGSNGKTTTKDILERILRKKWTPLKNFGTQNSLIGVPLTLLRLNDCHKSAVLEVGMNRAGEIKRLAEIARPNVGVVINIGPSHIQYLKSLRAVYEAKKELLDYLSKGDTAVLNNDDAFLRCFKKRGPRIITFGIKARSDFQAGNIEKIKNGWRFSVEGKSYSVPLIAYHNIYNALAAISVGRIFNVDAGEMKTALNNFKPLEMRMKRSVVRGIELIDDTYNSNPLSMENAIDTLVNYKARGRRILVSGDMLELGGRAAYYHKRIGRLIARSGINNFIGVGKLTHDSFLAAKRHGMENAWFCSSKEEAADLLKNIAQPNDVVLVKGSRSAKMEDVIKCFTTSFTP